MSTLLVVNHTCDETVLSEGSLKSSFPNLVGWFGYWVRQYSSNAHCDFSWSDSMCDTSERPQASVKGNEKYEMSVWDERCKFGHH